ncbi:MAG TPA: carboxypeptidase regulatory-like domain-containing protein [Pyrinomonadaceae bacterium]|nr:carboxypeptidase regulatory-like domain-containing protein [Pyrinomonadaceae bacterium]
MRRVYPDEDRALRIKINKSMRLQIFLMLGCVCLLLPLASPVYAQKSSGQVTGVVTDPNGAALPETTVTLTQTGTGLSREVKTNQDGYYAVPDLPIGTYRLTVSRSGFKEAVVDRITVNVSTNTRQDVTMQVGSLGEKVEVVASELQIESETGTVGGVVTGEQVRELPLNGRSFVQLTQLQPGVSPANNFDSKNKGLFSGVDFSVNGNTTQSNLFLIDGANNNDTGSNRTVLLYPSIEAISEFTMLRNSFSPEYGQASGAVISIATRGGENSFHGSLFYFGRNDKLNAADFFANRIGGSKDKLRRNDFGGSIGGPIIKDRLFFFYSQEWNKEIRGQTRFGSVPTLAERRGDFSTPRFAPNGTRCSGAAIGNGRPGSDTQIIPSSELSPAGAQIVRIFPEPNIASPNDCNNWRESTNSPIDFREENIRIDAQITKNNRIFGRYTQDHWENPAPILFSAGLWGDDAFPTVESSWQQPSKQAAVKLTSTLGNSAVNEVQFSYSANRINITPDQGGDINEALTTAIPGFFPESIKLNEGRRAHPTFWGGVAPYSTNFGPDLWTAAPWKNSLDIYSIRDDFSKVTGNHTFKLGFLYDWAAKDEDSLGAAASESPQFWGACCANNSGNYLADLLTRGSRFGFAETSTQPFARTRYRNFELYFGDTWKVRPNLTLELGTRYSYFPEPYDADDRMTSFDLRFYNPARPSSDFCNGIVAVPGTNPCAGIPGQSTPAEGVNRALRENDKNALAPRLGFAWDPFSNGKTAIRAGVGQFFQRERVSIALGMVANAPFALSIGGERTLDDNGANTFVISGAPGGAPSRSTNPEALLPNAWQWNLTVDQELWKDAVLEVGYVGNRALHQLISVDVNQVLPQNREAAAFCGGDGGCVNALRPAPNFGFIAGFERSGSATYHSLQTMFKTRIFGRSQIQAAYTWSHSIGDAALDDSSGGASVNTRTDTYNGRIDYGNTGINRPHIFVLNSVLYLPELKGSSGFVRSALGGWEFATIFTASSGSSITPRVANGSISNFQSAGLAGTGTSQSNVRPNRVPGVPCTIDGGEPFQLLNPAAFTLVGTRVGTPGNASRGSCLGPGINNVDMSFYKNFNPSWLRKPFGEGARVQLRLELFNAFNHTQFRADSLQNNVFINTGGNPVFCGSEVCGPSNPNRVVTSFTPNGGFGQSGTTRGPREIQYALKLVF